MHVPRERYVSTVVVDSADSMTSFENCIGSGGLKIKLNLESNGDWLGIFFFGGNAPKLFVNMGNYDGTSPPLHVADILVS